MKKNYNSFFFFLLPFVFVFLFIWNACKPTLALPEVEPESPIFKISADIEGRTTPVSFESGKDSRKMDIIKSTFQEILEAEETQIGSFAFIKPSYVKSSINTLPLLYDNDGKMGYTISLRPFSFTERYYDFFADGKLIKKNERELYENFTKTPPKILEIKDTKDSAVFKRFYNVVESPPSALMNIGSGLGLTVGSVGVSTFNWSTGSLTPVSKLDSSAASKYYCVTLTTGNPEVKTESCVLVKSVAGNFEATTVFLNLTVFPIITDNKLYSDEGWLAIRFTDTDGTIYNSEFGKQPNSTYFRVVRSEQYTPLDFSLNLLFDPKLASKSFVLAEVEFDVWVFNPYGKKLHLKNGKGTLLFTE